jgi:hypothetical protein
MMMMMISNIAGVWCGIPGLCLVISYEAALCSRVPRPNNTNGNGRKVKGWRLIQMGWAELVAPCCGLTSRALALPVQSLCAKMNFSFVFLYFSIFFFIILQAKTKINK